MNDREPMELAVPMSQRQREAAHYVLEDPHTYAVGFGGRRGGTKSRWSATMNCMRAIEAPKSLHLVLRRVQSAADMNMGREIDKVLDQLQVPRGSLRRGQVQYFSKEHQYKFPHGAVIWLGFCLREDDWERYQGVEADTVTFEEANQFPEIAYDKIGGSNRPGSPTLKGKRLVTFNPGGRGHEWTKRRFFNPITRDRRTVFVPAGIRDALPTLENDPGYALRVLRPLPDYLRKQWEDGDMDAVEGAFWDLHPAMFTDDVEIPDWADIYCGVDKGYFPSAFACVWFAKWRDHKGRVRIHVVRAIKRYRLSLVQMAEEALASEKVLPHRVRSRWGDPMIASRVESDERTTTTAAQVWARNRFAVLAAPRGPRAEGWLLMRTLMHESDSEDGYRLLTMSPSRCVPLIQELEAARHAAHSDDMEEPAEDDALDAWRYGIMATMFGHGSKKPSDKRKRDRQGRYRKPTTYVSQLGPA